MNIRWQNSIPYTIPLVVAERAAICLRRCPVVGNEVYVGPFAPLLGFVWMCVGQRTVMC
jgi:serine acetyltransferase